MSALEPIRSVVDYEDEVKQITKFLEKFVVNGKKQASVDMDDEMDIMDAVPDKQKPKYMALLRSVANREIDTVEVSLDDVREFEVATVDADLPFAQGSSLAFRIEHNARSYVELFSRAVDALLPEADESAMQDAGADVLDVLFQARRDRDRRDREALQTQGDAAAAAAESFPAALTRRYTVRFVPRSNQRAQAVREVGASQIGHLVTVRGIVTRVSDVRPAMVVAAYVCD
ncbi:DNA replication licensing factor MCM7, partial [Coemansia sp. RSA 551]